MSSPRRELAIDDPRHGTVNGYGNYGCRCEPCKAAKAEETREYNARTVERRKARYLTNPEKYRAARRAYVAANPDKVAAAKRAWYRDNAERILAQQREAYCSERNRANQLRIKYQMTPAEYDARNEAQQGLCAICGNEPTGRGKHGRLFVDHCHATGRVRGLLCGLCNAALGAFGDDPALLVRAIEYLRQSDEH